MKFRNLIIFSVSLMLILSLVACGSDKGNVEVDKDTSNAVDEFRTVTHAMGTTDVPINPKRVVILTNEGTEAILSLGVTPVGAVQSWTGNPWYNHISEEMKDAANVGLESQVNLEEIAALKPDLIIGNKMRQEKVYTQLSQIAPTVFSETLRGDWRENFEFYSEVLGKSEEGKDILNNFDEKIENIKEIAGDKLNTKVSILRFLPGKTRIYMGNSFSGVILKQLGFDRPESQQSDEFAVEIGKERLKEADGDVIFYFTYDKGDGEGISREKDWLNDPLFNSLEATKNGKIFRVDDAIWNTAGGIKAAILMLEDIENFLENNDL